MHEIASNMGSPDHYSKMINSRLILDRDKYIRKIKKREIDLYNQTIMKQKEEMKF